MADAAPVAYSISIAGKITTTSPKYRRMLADLAREVASSLEHDETIKSGSVTGTDDETGETWAVNWRITP